MAFRDAMDQLQPLRLRDLKLQAHLLFKQSQKDVSIAARFSVLPSFRGLSVDEVQQSLRLKHVYEYLAQQYGFAHWRELKHYVVVQDCLYRKHCVAYVYSWFTNYDAAKAYQNKHRGYLLRFWEDYIVCGTEYIRCIGMPIDHPDWNIIGYDWVRPKEREAFARLEAIAISNYIFIHK